ncbi:MAG: ABC transporter ATP-binding protein [archaeon]
MLLQLESLSKSFGGVKAVNNVSFQVKENSITSLIGPNGAGKTTLFNLVSGLMKPDEGKVIFKGEPITGFESHKIAELGLIRTFQLIKLFPSLTVMENLLLAKKQLGENFFTALTRKNFVLKEEKENINYCRHFLELVGLKEMENSLASDLSYGQRKLLEIARSLASDADLLLLDEPVAGVNPLMRKKIKEVLLNVKKEGKAILLIEHDLKFVLGLSDQVIVLDEGKLIAEGKPKEIKNNKKVIEAYIGEKVKL